MQKQVVLISKDRKYLKCPNCRRICTVTSVNEEDVDTDFRILLIDENENEIITGECRYCGYKITNDANITEKISKAGYFIDYDEDDSNVIRRIKFWSSAQYFPLYRKNTITILDSVRLDVLRRRYWNTRYVNGRPIKKHFTNHNYNLNVMFPKNILLDFVNDVNSNTRYKLFNSKYIPVIKSSVRLSDTKIATSVFKSLKYCNIIIDDEYRLVGIFDRMCYHRLRRKIKESNNPRLLKLTYYDLAELILAKKPNKYKNFDLEKFKLFFEFAKIFDMFHTKFVSILYVLTDISRKISDFRKLLRLVLIDSVVIISAIKSEEDKEFAEFLNMLIETNDLTEIVKHASKGNASYELFTSITYDDIMNTELDKLLKSVYAAI